MNRLDLLIPAILLLFAFRIARRGARERPVRIERMWILPVFFTAMVVLGISREPLPLSVAVAATFAAAAILGVGVGWLRGRTTRITIEPDTHVIKRQASAGGLILVAGLFLARNLLRGYLSGHAEAWHIPPAAIVDGFLLFTLGMVVGRRIEIMIRAMRLLREARVARGEGRSVPPEVTEEHA